MGVGVGFGVGVGVGVPVVGAFVSVCIGVGVWVAVSVGIGVEVEPEVSEGTSVFSVSLGVLCNVLSVGLGVGFVLSCVLHPVTTISVIIKSNANKVSP